MNWKSSARLLPVMLVMGLASCATQTTTGITRVKIYRLDPTAVADSAEPSIPFEQKHYLYGAVSDADREARRGNYYTIFFKTPDRQTPVQARFEYRQQATGFKVFTKTVSVEPGSGRVRFQVSGDEYRERGKLLGWRVTLTQGGQMIGQRKSYLWD